VAGRYDLAITMIPSASVLGGMLSRFSGELRSTREPLEQIRDTVFTPRMGWNFANQSAAGSRWEPITDSTRKAPERSTLSRGNNPILDVRGRLKRIAAQKNIWVINGQQAEIFITQDSINAAQGGNAWYGGLHQLGYAARDGSPIPARPWIAFTEGDFQKAGEIFGDWLGSKWSLTVAGGSTVGEIYSDSYV
jgi:phage gpG-like protein